MDRYVRVRSHSSGEKAAENEIRITSPGKPRHYITYATTLMTEKEHSSIIVRATGKAINKAVAIAEIVKRRIAGLHQSTVIGSTDITDHWDPKEGEDPDLKPIETTRRVSIITITLSKEPLDASAVGYQAPLPEDQVTPLQDNLGLEDDDDEKEGEGGHRRRRGRGRGRGGRGRDGHFARNASNAEAGVGEGEDAAGQAEGAKKRPPRRRKPRGGRGKLDDAEGGEGPSAPAAAGGAAGEGGEKKSSETAPAATATATES